MATPIVNSPFKDKITKPVPKRGSAGGYDSMQNLPEGMPSRTTSDSGVPEKYYDGAVTNGTKSAPSLSGPIKTFFKDAAGKK
jgi:hypothetical protein